MYFLGCLGVLLALNGFEPNGPMFNMRMTTTREEGVPGRGEPPKLLLFVEPL